MNLIFLFDRLRNVFSRKYRKYVFKKSIQCNHNDFNLVGDIILINKNINLGHNVTIYPNVMFWGDGTIEIDDNVDIGTGTILYASKNGGIKIGKNTMIAAQCYVIDMDHGIIKDSLICNQENTIEKVLIGEDCWIAANATILKGSIVENGAVIGAKSLVRDI